MEHLKRAYDVDDDVNVAAEKILDDSDFKKIRYLKMRKDVQSLNRMKFEDSDIEEQEGGQSKMLKKRRKRSFDNSEEEEEEDSDDSAEGEYDSEEGEEELEEGGSEQEGED